MIPTRTIVIALAALLGTVVPVYAEGGCELYTQETFPYGMVWWRIDPARGRDTGIGGFPEGRTAYLVTGVRPDGILVQNREARFPRLLSWKVVGRSQLSTDGRRGWRPGCAP